MSEPQLHTIMALSDLSRLIKRRYPFKGWHPTTQELRDLIVEGEENPAGKRVFLKGHKWRKGYQSSLSWYLDYLYEYHRGW